MRMRLGLAIMACAFPLLAIAQEYFVKEVVFPENATLEEKVEMASRLVPSEKQMAWQDLELTAFLHFGVNTFTNREWGDGHESESIFNPDSLDTDQWAKALSEAGFKMAILTAKHHDGFCLWPTATTAHSVASSPWLDGKGDVVKMLSESCRKYGIKLGIYLSPWDRNAECYGDSPRYNDMFVAQLTELLTNYGVVDEVWFDGACGEGPNGKRQVYDWKRIKETIETLQPEAVMAIMGDDVRWVGNEKGLGRETEWSATALMPGILPDADSINHSHGLKNLSHDLGSRKIIEQVDRLYWYPSEVDVSIRPGWFWHESESPKSLRELADIYIHSVGRNSVLLLNIPPNNRGLISQEDVKRLMEFKRWRDANFTDNLAATDSLATTLIDKANAIVLAEDITKGQRVEEFEIEVKGPDGWQPVFHGTTIGKKRIAMLDIEAQDSIKVNILQSRGEPNVSILGAYNVVLPRHVRTGIANGVAAIDKSLWLADLEYANAFDGKDATICQVQGELSLSLGETVDVVGFVYTPRQDGIHDGIAYTYAFYTSLDGQNWNLCPTSGEFSNISANPIPQIVAFPSSVPARFVKLECLSTIDNAPKFTIAEFDILVSAP